MVIWATPRRLIAEASAIKSQSASGMPATTNPTATAVKATCSQKRTRPYLVPVERPTAPTVSTRRTYPDGCFEAGSAKANSNDDPCTGRTPLVEPQVTTTGGVTGGFGPARDDVLSSGHLNVRWPGERLRWQNGVRARSRRLSGQIASIDDLTRLTAVGCEGEGAG